MEETVISAREAKEIGFNKKLEVSEIDKLIGSSFDDLRDRLIIEIKKSLDKKERFAIIKMVFKTIKSQKECLNLLEEYFYNIHGYSISMYAENDKAKQTDPLTIKLEW